MACEVQTKEYKPMFEKKWDGRAYLPMDEMQPSFESFFSRFAESKFDTELKTASYTKSGSDYAKTRVYYYIDYAKYCYFRNSEELVKEMEPVALDSGDFINAYVYLWYSLEQLLGVRSSEMSEYLSAVGKQKEDKARKIEAQVRSGSPVFESEQIVTNFKRHQIDIMDEEMRLTMAAALLASVSTENIGWIISLQNTIQTAFLFQNPETPLDGEDDLDFD